MHESLEAPTNGRMLHVFAQSNSGDSLELGSLERMDLPERTLLFLPKTRQCSLSKRPLYLMPLSLSLFLYFHIDM